jgi:hypothetical protein
MATGTNTYARRPPFWDIRRKEANARQARFSGLPIHVPLALGQKFICEKGGIVNGFPSRSME